MHESNARPVRLSERGRRRPGVACGIAPYHQHIPTPAVPVCSLQFLDVNDRARSAMIDEGPGERYRTASVIRVGLPDCRLIGSGCPASLSPREMAFYRPTQRLMS